MEMHVTTFPDLPNTKETCIARCVMSCKLQLIEAQQSVFGTTTTCVWRTRSEIKETVGGGFIGGNFRGVADLIFCCHIAHMQLY